MKHSESLTKIAPALVKALAEIGGVAKGANNPFFKSKYATLENVIDASKPVLASHGISLLQFPGALVGGAMNLETILLHESGEWIGGEEAFGVSTTKADPQAVGSALSYARRYAQMAVLNMPAVDDDGEAAMPRQQQKNPTVSVDNGGPDWWGASGPGEMSAYSLKKDHPEVAKEFDDWMGVPDHIHTAAEWKEWCAKNDAAIKRLPKSWRQELRAVFEIRGKELGALPND